MRIRLVAVDLDGTLLGGTEGRYGIFPEGISALRRAVGMQAAVAIVTGRDFEFVPELLKTEGVQWSQEQWPHLIIAEERCEYRLQNGQYAPDSEWNEEIRVLERGHFEQISDGVNQLLSSRIASIDPGACRRTEVLEAERGFIEIRFTDANAARAAEPLLAAMLAQSLLPYKTVRNAADISIRYLSVGKGAMLQRACQRLGIAAEEVLAIGDSANDLSMLDGRFGFVGAAPGNADDEVKAAVRARGGVVSESRYAKGVAEILDYYMAGHRQTPASRL